MRFHRSETHQGLRVAIDMNFELGDLLKYGHEKVPYLILRSALKVQKAGVYPVYVFQWGCYGELQRVVVAMLKRRNICVWEPTCAAKALRYLLKNRIVDFIASDDQHACNWGVGRVFRKFSRCFVMSETTFYTLTCYLLATGTETMS
jgi:hypothetical protein